MPANPPTTPGVPRRPRCGCGCFVVVLVAGILIFLAALPYLASIGPIRDFLFRFVAPDIHGSVHVGGARLGWFSPVEFEDIEIRSADGEPVVSVPRLEGNRTLWQMVSSRSNLGDFRIERPKLNVVLDKKGSNLSQVFAGRKADEPKASEPPNVALGVQLIDGSVTVRDAGSERPWTAEPINFGFRLKPGSASPDGEPRLEIEPATVFSHTQVTPEVCHDLLKYIAPVLSDATEVSGDFSMTLDRWEFPMSDFAQGEGSGQLTIHDLDVSPGPLALELAKKLKLPPKLTLVKDEPIAFRMADGRVYHSRLTFRLGQLEISTSGSVGADGTLDMTAEMPMPAHLLGEGPLLKALDGQTLRIPIKGTLAKPEVDLEGLAGSALDMADGVIKELSKDGQLDLNEMFKAIQKRREERLKKQTDETDKGDKANKEPNQPIRRLLRGVFDEALQEESRQ